MRYRGLYWLVPTSAALFWTVNLLGLVSIWSTTGANHFVGTAVVDGQTRKKYASSVFISDIGAEHQAYFIVFCILTALAYISTVLIERYLRHARYIPGSLRRRTTVLDVCSLVSAVAGSVGLVLLSIFNTFDHGGFHWSMTALFLVGTLLSVLLQTLVVYDLAHSHASWSGRFKVLLWPATVKLVVLSLALAVAIAFGVLYLSCSGEKYFEAGNEEKCSRHIAGAAGCEWTIAFLLVPYLLSYAYDFYPARKDLGAAGFTTTRRPAGLPTTHMACSSVPLVEGFDPSQPSLPARLAAQGISKDTLVCEPYLSPLPSNVPSSITVVPLPLSDKDKLVTPGSPAGSEALLFTPLSGTSDHKAFFLSTPDTEDSAGYTCHTMGEPAPSSQVQPQAQVQPQWEGARHRSNRSIPVPYPDLPHPPTRGLTYPTSEVWR